MMRRIPILVTLLLALATPALAQHDKGIRAGVSADPNQFFVGGHIETSPVADHLTFRPNVEVGLGEGLLLVAINVEFAYWLNDHNRSWHFYVGGGPALIVEARR